MTRTRLLLVGMIGMGESFLKGSPICPEARLIGKTIRHNPYCANLELTRVLVSFPVMTKHLRIKRQNPVSIRTVSLPPDQAQ